MTLHRLRPRQPRTVLPAAVLTVLTAAVLTGCGHHAGSHAGHHDRVGGGRAGTDTVVLPIGQQGLDRIAVVLRQQIDADVMPGAVSLIARDGQVIHYQAHGWLDAGKTRPMPKDALFRLASMTKPITSVAAMMLVEQGAMQINDPISKWLPEFKDTPVETPKGNVAQARPITVQDLLRHSAGLVYGGGTKSAAIGKAMVDGNIESREVDISAKEMLARLGRIPLAHQPGTVWEYSVATDVLGLLLERVAGKRLDVLFNDLLLGPLGMQDTAFWVPAGKMGRLAEALDADPQKATLLRSYRIAQPPTDAGYLKGGAGLVGTTTDYLKFAQMVANGGEFEGRRYLSQKTVDFMLSDHILGFGGNTQATTGPGYGFGLGFGVRRDPGMNWVAGSVGEATWSGAWGTTFWIDREQRLVAILMTQAPSPRLATRMLYRTLVYGAVGG